jgi:hypothetical protein
MLDHGTLTQAREAGGFRRRLVGLFLVSRLRGLFF